MLEIKQLTRLQIIRYCEKLEKENKKLKECNKSQSEVINNVFIPQKERLEEENETLKANVEFLHSCLDDRENSIEIMKEENKKFKEDTEYTIKFNNNIIGKLKLENDKLKEEIGKLVMKS